jgi:hypothetical protein
MGVGGVDGGYGDGDEEGGEEERSDDARGVHAGVGVASFNSGKESRPALR